MAEKKKRWTAVDTVIVIVAAAAVAVGFKMLGGRMMGGTRTHLTAQILIPNQNPELGDAVKNAIGSSVTLSITEKDSGIIKDVKIEPATVMVYNSIEGKYVNQVSADNVDIVATVALDAEETGYDFLVGTTPIKVGNPTPFRGKGYATEGNVIAIEKEEK